MMQYSARGRARATAADGRASGGQHAARSPLLAALATRVRAAREAAGLTQRALAARAAMSPRFLAQLEAGDGNISLERFAALARALGSAPGALLADLPLAGAGTTASTAARGDGARGDGPPGSGARGERALIDGILAPRNLAELSEVRRFLEARFATRPAPVIALVGLRGAGKSTIGPRLATRLGLGFLEVDRAVERAAGLSLAELFELHGEGYYRRLQREVLTGLLADSHAGLVLATGGGLVNDRDTWELLRRRAVTVWIKARPEDHWNRVIQQGDQRPMAEHPHAMAELRALLAARERLYAQAEHTLDTSRLDVDGAVERLARALAGPRGAAASSGPRATTASGPRGAAASSGPRATTASGPRGTAASSGPRGTSPSGRKATRPARTRS